MIRPKAGTAAPAWFSAGSVAEPVQEADRDEAADTDNDGDADADAATVAACAGPGRTSTDTSKASAITTVRTFMSGPSRMPP